MCFQHHEMRYMRRLFGDVQNLLNALNSVKLQPSLDATQPTDCRPMYMRGIDKRVIVECPSSNGGIVRV